MDADDDLLSYAHNPTNRWVLEDESFNFDSEGFGNQLPDKTPQSSKAKSSHRRQPPPVPPNPVGDFEAREEVWSKELEEARTRLAQMEKTMRYEF